MIRITNKLPVCILIAFLSLIFIDSTLPNVKDLINQNPKTTAFIELRRIEAQQQELLFDLQWEWLPISQIPPHVLTTVVASEDPDFWTHRGINWNSIQKAILNNWRHLSFKQGGSSISQQLAKNLYLSPAKTPMRKICECLIAWKLEYYLSKERILEIYLNIAEWGNGVFGIRAAAYYWFHKTPSQLTIEETNYLISILPYPLTRFPR